VDAEGELNYERLDGMADPGLMIVVYPAEPGSRVGRVARSARELAGDRSRGSRSARFSR
jgi:hypothetical protein